MSEILLIDDNETDVELLVTLMKEEGYDVDTVQNVEEGCERLKEENYGVAFLDVTGDFNSRGKLVQELREISPDTPVVLSVSQEELKQFEPVSDISNVAYVRKPFRIEALMDTLENILEFQEKQESGEEIPELQLYRCFEYPEFVIESEAMTKASRAVERAESVEIPVLIYGESGTEKELVARTLHDRSKHPSAPFVTFDLKDQLKDFETRIQNGVNAENPLRSFESEAEGIVFIENFHLLPSELQNKFGEWVKRAKAEGNTQSMPRFVAGSEVSCPELQKKGFNATLCVFFGTLNIEIKPLREREEDIVPLFTQLLRKATSNLGKQECEVSDVVNGEIKEYQWEGNFDQMKYVADFIAEKMPEDQNKVTSELLDQALKASQESG